MKKPLIVFTFIFFSLMMNAAFAAKMHYLGKGTLGDPYQVDSCAGLQNMAAMLNAHYILTQNIDCAVTKLWYGGTGFEPIGSSSTPFTGTFNGNGYTISDVYINRPGRENTGLFGYAQNATFDNIRLVNETVVGGNHTGGLIGDATSSGSETQIKLSHITVSGKITAESSTHGNLNGNADAGGVVGKLGGLIQNSDATVEVIALGSNIPSAGGLVGYLIQNGDIRYSHATADVYNSAGSSPGNGCGAGLAGTINGGEVSHSYAAGVIEGNGNEGGLVGANIWSGKIKHSYASAKISSKNITGRKSLGRVAWG